MSKKRAHAGSLGEITAGHLKGTAEGLKRLASPHPSVRHILEVIDRMQARPYTTHALIGGEPGTGKEGLAHTLHELMHPEGGPLVVVSMAGRAEDDVAAELFGAAPQHKGERPTDGAVEEADGGTLVLDEVIGLSAGMQRRLLDLAKKGRYRREGEQRERRVQLCIFVVTDGNLLAEVTAGRFRHDLYHKLARLDLVLPPLRERPEDVPGAAVWMANRVLADRGREPNVELEPAAGEAPVEEGAIVFRREAIETLRQHRWPGNFRELEIIVERALLLYGDGAQITTHDITRALADPRG
ncbi:MAG TPA: sigma 54-interacting transcriptional regulator [Polyangia bacterium]|nr:sigma 54-interacting transcriptional regulator [Polyangia bacterium]